MKKMAKNNLFLAILTIGFLFNTSVTKAEYDGGVGPDGTVVICSKTLSLRCGMSSKDAEDKDTLVACLDSIATNMYGSPDHKQSINDLRDKILHECNRHFMKMAVQYKAHAGDFEDKGKENGFLEFKTDKHGKGAQDINVAASNGKNVVKLTDLAAASYMIKALETYFANLADRDISENTIESGGRAPGEG